MSNYGFVYVMTNHAMCCFKVGCTERAPHARAEELSRTTGVPVAFEVACYIEIEDFQAAERQIHGWLAKHRVSASREFFWDDAFQFACRILYFHPRALSFCEVDERLAGWDIRNVELNPFAKQEEKKEETNDSSPESEQPSSEEQAA